MQKHLGIVACSPPGAALCYEIASTEASRLASRPGDGVEVSVHCHSLAEYLRCIKADEWDGVAELMRSSARKLISIGAELLVVPCNLIHTAFERAAAGSPVPWLHIAAEVALAARSRSYKRVGLLGTAIVMEGPIYPSQFKRYGIDLCVPDPSERERLNRLLFDEMIYGKFTVEAREYVLQLLRKMKLQGCDAAGLCCTELPVLLKAVDSPIPLLDSTKILAHAAIERLECRS
jgi:aspartate racemase